MEPHTAEPATLKISSAGWATNAPNVNSERKEGAKYCLLASILFEAINNRCLGVEVKNQGEGKHTWPDCPLSGLGY